MSTELRFISSALYVAFTYGCIAFGALAYRQIADNLTVKGVRLGEEIVLMQDPRVYVAIGFFGVIFGIFVTVICSRDSTMVEGLYLSAPGLIFYVVPLLVVINVVQLFLRSRWQRLSVRTQGMLVRRLFSERYFPLAYDDIEFVSVNNESLWYVLRVHSHEYDAPTSIYLGPRGTRYLCEMLETKGIAIQQP